MRLIKSHHILASGFHPCEMLLNGSICSRRRHLYRRCQSKTRALTTAPVMNRAAAGGSPSRTTFQTNIFPTRRVRDLCWLSSFPLKKAFPRNAISHGSSSAGNMKLALWSYTRQCIGTQQGEMTFDSFFPDWRKGTTLREFRAELSASNSVGHFPFLASLRKGSAREGADIAQ